MENLKISGLLIVIAGTVFAFGMLTAGFLFPDYSDSRQTISALGAQCSTDASDCVVHEPSAAIFNGSLILFGLLILISFFISRKEFLPSAKIFFVFAVIAGLGGIGSGLFPDNTGLMHELFAGVGFFFGSLTVISSFKIIRKPLNYFSLLMGIISLSALVLFVSDVHLGLGSGGMERMIIYPILLWMVSFGSYLISSGVVFEK